MGKQKEISIRTTINGIENGQGEKNQWNEQMVVENIDKIGKLLTKEREDTN